MTVGSLSTSGHSRTVLPCGVEVTRFVGLLDPARPETMLHTVIVAGQHGAEPGPVLALLHQRDVQNRLCQARTGVITIVRCANPSGFSIGSRFDGDGRDMNRDWTAERVRNLGTAQGQLWQAIAGDFPPEVYPMLVLDLHSSGAAGPLPRRVVTCDGAGTDLAASLAAALRAADDGVIDDRDPTWGVLDMRTDADPSDRERFHPAGLLSGWAIASGGTGFTVEFAEHTYRPLPVGHDGEEGHNGKGRRVMTIGERTHGVGTLLAWAVGRHRAG